MTHTQRTLKYYRDQGFVCGMAERWVPNPKHPAGGFRKDFLGIIDIIGIAGPLTIGIQSCGDSFAEHDRTIRSNENSIKWLEGNTRSLVLISWGLRKKKRGGKQMIYKPRIKVYTLEDL